MLEPILHVFELLEAAYALIGARAMAARGYPRFTVDVDVMTADHRVFDPALWEDLVSRGATVDIRRGNTDDPLGGVISVQRPDEMDVDIVVAKWKWEAALIARAEPVLIDNLTVRVPVLGDLILLKLAAGGSLDLHDAAALLRLGDETTIRHVEAYLPDVRPDVRGAWEQIRNDR